MTTPDADAVPSLDPTGDVDAGTASFHAAGRAVAGLGTDIASTLAWAVASAPLLPDPGDGGTARRWEMLASIAALDVAAARILEPHADALSILAEAEAQGRRPDQAVTPADAAWGVYAAEGPGARLVATRGPDDTWHLRGVKPWCSLAGDLDYALVTAWTGEGTRRLFAVDLRAPGITARTGPWEPRGLTQVVSAPVDFDDVAAYPVGEDGWYLRRDGFAWGGLGVAAVWWGATLPLVRALTDRAAREGADQLAEVSAGAASALAWSMRSVLAEAARLVDGGQSSPGGAVDGGEPSTASAVDGDHPSPARLAAVVRAVVHDGARRIRDLAVQGLGPGPLTTDAQYARRIADLEVYLGQHHGDRDLARLGRP